MSETEREEEHSEEEWEALAAEEPAERDSPLEEPSHPASSPDEEEGGRRWP